MSKINSTKKPSKVMVGEIAGVKGLVAKESPFMQLRRVTLANLLWEDNAYVDGEKTANAISELIPQCDPVDVANLALETRTLQKLRHTPLYIVSEMCKYDNMKKYVPELLPRIITRADMLTDFLAIYWKGTNKKERPLANCAKKGLAAAFHNFNEYKFAKYDRNAPIKLRDVMFLVHPKPVDQNETALFNKIAERTLETPETWETMLSAGLDKKKTWEYLISERKIGGLAMLRNLRNMVDAGVSRSTIEDGIANMNGSMLLPLDYLKANKESNGSFERVIEDKMLLSYSNLPKISGKTLFILDVSGSMCARISGRSNFSRIDVAAAMAMLASEQCEDFDLMLTSGSDARYTESHKFVKMPPRGFKFIDYVKKEFNSYSLGGGGIFTRQALEAAASELGTDYDRIIVFSDSQDCDYGNRRIPKPFAKYNYICDVSSELYGVNYKGVWTAEISGWSEHFLSYIAAYEGIENVFDEQ